MREFYKALGVCSPAHFPRCSLHWAAAAVGLIRQSESFQRLHDGEAGDTDSWDNSPLQLYLPDLSPILSWDYQSDRADLHLSSMFFFVCLCF